MSSNGMSSRTGSYDVLVIGGGIIGLSVAWRARAKGLAVTLLERGRLGEGTSRVAAGMLAPVAETEFGAAGRRLLDLGLRSAALWPGFAAELERAADAQVGLLRTGTLMVARDADEARELERQLEFRRSLGLRAERLRAGVAREREPGLAPTVRLALEVPDDHSVDPRLVLGALRVACERAGVVLREGAEVEAVELAGNTGVLAGASGTPADTPTADEPDAASADETDTPAADETDAASADETDTPAVDETDAASAGARVTGVRLCGGERVPAGQVVVAAGAWSERIGGLPASARVRVRPVKGQIMRLRDPAGPGLLRRVVRFAGGYLVPRSDGRYVLGATAEEQGFDLEPTAGGVRDLLRHAGELVPGIDELRIEELSVGLRPGTPDNTPAIGPATLDGLLWATGHYRNGILLAPLTAELIAAELAGEPMAGGPIGGTGSGGAGSGGADRARVHDTQAVSA